MKGFQRGKWLVFLAIGMIFLSVEAAHVDVVEDLPNDTVLPEKKPKNPSNFNFFQMLKRRWNEIGSKKPSSSQQALPKPTQSPQGKGGISSVVVGDSTGVVDKTLTSKDEPAIKTQGKGFFSFLRRTPKGPRPVSENSEVKKLKSSLMKDLSSPEKQLFNKVLAEKGPEGETQEEYMARMKVIQVAEKIVMQAFVDVYSQRANTDLVTSQKDELSGRIVNKNTLSDTTFQKTILTLGDTVGRSSIEAQLGKLLKSLSPETQVVIKQMLDILFKGYKKIKYQKTTPGKTTYKQTTEEEIITSSLFKAFTDQASNKAVSAYRQSHRKQLDLNELRRDLYIQTRK